MRTREEILLAALDASMEREREMGDRLIQMEQRLDGVPLQTEESAIERWLAKEGIPLSALAISDISITRYLNAPTEIRIVAHRPTLGLGASMVRATETMRRLAKTYSLAGFSFSGGSEYAVSPDDLKE